MWLEIDFLWDVCTFIGVQLDKACVHAPQHLHWHDPGPKNIQECQSWLRGITCILSAHEMQSCIIIVHSPRYFSWLLCDKTGQLERGIISCWKDATKCWGVHVPSVIRFSLFQINWHKDQTPTRCQSQIFVHSSFKLHENILTDGCELQRCKRSQTAPLLRVSGIWTAQTDHLLPWAIWGFKKKSCDFELSVTHEV